MKKFLILGEPGDTHAQYVSWALGTAGYQTTFVNALHESSPTRTNLYLSDTADAFASTDWSEAEAAWSRRLPGPPMLDGALGENEGFALVQENRFTKWLFEMQESCCPIRWINSPGGAMAAENKFLQLKKARSHGLRVPRTLITAQPGRFRSFLQEEGAIVVKPLTGYRWEYKSGETVTAFANIIDAKRGSELADEDIAQCVTIYQQRIEKVADVRMVVMGNDMFAYRIDQAGEQHFDFRVGFFQKDHLRYQPIPIPDSLKRSMSGLMDSMNINFASTDFALTADNEFVFLDLNPNGQWLFIEAVSPETRVGQKFCSFFVGGQVDPELENLFPSYAEFTESDAARSMADAFRQHTATRTRPAVAWQESKA